MAAPTGLPAFDNTLGALFIGLNLASILYGINCVQIFIYSTSRRSKRDNLWLKSFMYGIFILDSGHQVTNMTAMYRLLIGDFVNPIALLDPSPKGGRFMLALEACFGAAMIFAVQLYFSWRVYAFNRSSRASWRWLASLLTLSSALVTCVANTFIVVKSFNKRADLAFFWNTEEILRDWKIALPSAIVCDVIITLAMVFSLWRSRTGIKRTDHSLNVLISFTVNTGLVTTLLTIASLVAFIVLPNTLIYAALEFLVPKSYVNSAMAVVNSREYLRDKIKGDLPLSTLSSKDQTRPMSGNFNVTSYWEDRHISRLSTTSLPPPTYDPLNGSPLESPRQGPQSPHDLYTAYTPQQSFRMGTCRQPILIDDKQSRNSSYVAVGKAI